jgi:hypothetical protein
MNNPSFQEIFFGKLTGEGLSGNQKKPGTFLVVISTGDTRIGKICYDEIILLC